MCVFWKETSAGLQRILQEIQPRDTNDFFTRARELDTHQGDDHAQTQTTHTPSLNTSELEITLHRKMSCHASLVPTAQYYISSDVFKLWGMGELKGGECGGAEEDTRGKDTVWGYRDSCMLVFWKQQEVSCCGLAADLARYQHGQQLELQQWLWLTAHRGSQGTFKPLALISPICAKNHTPSRNKSVKCKPTWYTRDQWWLQK